MICPTCGRSMTMLHQAKMLVLAALAVPGVRVAAALPGATTSRRGMLVYLLRAAGLLEEPSDGGLRATVLARSAIDDPIAFVAAWRRAARVVRKADVRRAA